jgi:polysaccharide pyruvyl transferase WcaK-like protein
MKLLIMQFSPVLCFSPPAPYLPNHLFSDTLNLCSPLNVRDQVSHTYKKMGKIVVLYILTLIFLESEQDKRLWTEW